MATIKELESRLAVAKTARERAELTAGIAFLRKQAAARAAKAAESTSLSACAKRAGMSVAEYCHFHGC